MKATKPSFERIDTFSNLPFYSQSVAAGFPSPADDFLEFDLSLDKKLIKHPSATFFVRVSGTSMINAKIFDGSILLVDRAEKIKTMMLSLPSLTETLQLRGIGSSEAVSSCILRIRR